MSYRKEELLYGSHTAFEDTQLQSSYNLRIKRELEDILAKIIETYNFDAGAIYLENGSAPGTFELIVASGFSQEYLSDVNKIFMGIGFSGTAAELRQARVSEDATNDIRFIRKKYKENINSFIAIPVISAEKSFGIISLGTESKRNFSSQEIEALSLHGSLLGSYIESSYRLWLNQKKGNEIKHLYSLGKEIIGFEEINTICLVTLEECRVLMKADSAFIIFENNILENKRVLSTGLITDSFTEEIVGYFSGGFSKGDHIVIHKSDEVNVLSSFFNENKMEHLYCIKLTVNDRIFGILGVARSSSRNDGFDLDLFKRINWHLSIAIGKYFFIKQAKSMTILEEQSRISRELHDSLSQQLLAMLNSTEYILRTCKIEADNNLIQHMNALSSLIEMTYADVREAIFGLRITNIHDETTFGDAVKKCINHFQSSSGFSIDANICFKQQLPYFIQIQLLRIIQEALANIRKHSKADLINLDLSQTDNSLKISVSDNGCGFNADNINSGYGLSVMKERADDIGAVLEIKSEENKGTSITVVLENITEV
jgi:signal transduction histidine kinase